MERVAADELLQYKNQQVLNPIKSGAKLFFSFYTQLDRKANFARLVHS
jgi:Na+-transporting NADH:ubiquinone oxidoreductase subunit NqrB